MGLQIAFRWLLDVEDLVEDILAFYPVAFGDIRRYTPAIRTAHWYRLSEKAGGEGPSECGL